MCIVYVRESQRLNLLYYWLLKIKRADRILPFEVFHHFYLWRFLKALLDLQFFESVCFSILNKTESEKLLLKASFKYQIFSHVLSTKKRDYHHLLAWCLSPPRPPLVTSSPVSSPLFDITANMPGKTLALINHMQHGGSRF